MFTYKLRAYMSYSTVILYTYRILYWNLRLPQHWSRRQKPQFASPVLWQVRHWTCWPPDCAAGGSFQVLKEGWMTNLPFRWQSMGFLPIDSENQKKRPSFTVFRKDRITFFKPQFFLEKNTWWKTQGFILLFWTSRWVIPPVGVGEKPCSWFCI